MTDARIAALGYPGAEQDRHGNWHQLPPDSNAEGVFGSLKVVIGAGWDTYGTAYAANGSAAVQIGTIPGTDITTINDVPTLVQDLQWIDGGGETTGLLELPELAPFDAPAWLVGGANVDIYRVLPAAEAATAGTATVPYWHGHVQSIQVEDGDGVSTSVRLHLQGALYGETLVRAHQPLLFDTANDVGTWLGRALDPALYSRPFTPFMRFSFESTTTNILTRYRGSRGQMTWDYVSEILALAQDDNAQWTIRRAYQTLGGRTYPRARHYYLDEVSTELAGAVQQNTVFAGGYGVALSLSQDVTESANVIMGEGVHPVDNSDLSGGRWRNKVTPLQSPSMPSYPSRVSGSTYPIALGDTNGDFTTDVISQLTGALRAASAPSVTIGTVLTAVGTAAISALKEDTGWANTNGNIGGTAEWAWLFGASALYPGSDLLSGWCKPLAFDSRVALYDYTPAGDIQAVNDAFDPTVLRVERVIGYGEGIAKADARKNARAIVRREIAAPWIGTVTLTLDPTDETGAARSRLNIREGGWLRINGLNAGTYRDFHIAGVQVAWQTPGAPVTLTVSETPFSYLDLATQMARIREAKTNRAKSFFSQLTKTVTPFKSVSGWDTEGGAGVIPAMALGSGAWTVATVIAAQYGSIGALKMELDPPQPFALAVFGGTPVAADIEAVVPAPLGSVTGDYSSWWRHPDNADALVDLGFIESWGRYGEAAGYTPGRESAGSAVAAGSVTGKVDDALGWQFASVDGYLRLGVWASLGGSVVPGAAMRIVPDEG